MTTQRRDDHLFLKLCFNCANVYIPKKGHPLFKCPECKAIQSPFKYKKFLSIAHYAFRYGYDYRETYENQFQKDAEIKTHHCLAQAPEYWNFIALAALSGIIGGISYDIVKKVLLKITNKIRQLHLDTKRINKFANHEEEFHKLIRYIEDFRNGFEKVHPKIRNAILQEIQIDPVSKRIAKLVIELLHKKSLSNKVDKKEMIRIIETSLKYKTKLPIEKIRDFSQNDFNKFWNKVLIEEKKKRNKRRK